MFDSIATDFLARALLELMPTDPITRGLLKLVGVILAIVIVCIFLKGLLSWLKKREEENKLGVRYLLVFGTTQEYIKTLKEMGVDMKELQRLADLYLKELALSTDRAFRYEEALRAKMASAPLKGLKELKESKESAIESKTKFWEAHAFVKAAGFRVKNSIKDYCPEACKNHLLL